MTDLSKLSPAELLAFAQKLQAQASQPKRLTMKVSTKGALSIYGLGRFPVTLYTGQWERLLDAADDVRTFLKANAASLKTKGED